MTSTPRRVSLAFLHAFQDLDVDAHLALRSPNCCHTIAPASLNYPEMSNSQFATHLTSLKSVIEKFPVMPKEVFEHEGGNQVTVWATSDATFRDDVKDDDQEVDWSYHGEYMFVFFFDPSGDKIERIIEFIDSRKVVEVRKLMERAKRNLAARERARDNEMGITAGGASG